MAENSSEHHADKEADLLKRSLDGDDSAFAELFDRYRPRLKRMIALRINQRIQTRVDESDVVQEAFIDMAERLHEYAKDPKIEFYLWMRLVAGQRLGQVHRRHLGAQKRDAEREISINANPIPCASTLCLASRLVGQFTAVSEVAMRAERQRELAEVLNAMDEEDREVLALKHFEEMSNLEISQVLGISESGARKRYIMALGRLQEALKRARPGLFDETGIR